MEGVARINGVKMHLDKLTDTEIDNMVGYTHERIEGAVSDLEALGIESARRWGGIAVEQVVDPQGTLF